jgi:hypothetical protein
LSWVFTNKQAKDAYEYILENRLKAKRTVFEIEWLDEWLEWLADNDYLFTNYDNGKVNGVITIFKTQRCDKKPNLKTLLYNITIKHKENDFFIMDALVDNAQSRVNLVNKILAKYPEIETDQNVQLWACRKGKVVKLDKQKILTLKK